MTRAIPTPQTRSMNSNSDTLSLGDAIFEISGANAMPVANALSATYGRDAKAIALMYAETLANSGNVGRSDSWLRVVKLLNHMQITRQRGVIHSPRK